ncbi:hypothetical protein ACO2Q8_13570 [Larkinella sp. VNQ87]|uniref:hypothetical protein n=1 Tax=Larkinella sp. VNQ87 TaxID=3400921 RepID=UPI003C01943C
MVTDVTQQVDQIASQLGLTKDEVIQQSLRYFLEGKLRELWAERVELQTQYHVTTPEEFEQLYKDDQVDEASSWRDYQRFETLTFKIEQLKTRFASLCNS